MKESWLDSMWPILEKVVTSDPILITGSAGFIGTRVVENLLERGFSNLRCFVRPSSALERLNEILKKHCSARKVEIIAGDLASCEDCRKAAENISVAFHLAAGFQKSFVEALRNSALITRNLIEALLELGKLKRFVNVSSFAVYSNLRMTRGALLDEASPLEDAPEERCDAYALAKLKQEEVVREYGRTHGLPFVILRPGTVFGPGKKQLTGRIGISVFGVFLHIGGSNLLPLTYVTNCADAIVHAGIAPGAVGETFNIVDDDLLTSREFLRAYRRRVKRLPCVRFPYFAAYLLSAMYECFGKYLSRRSPRFNRRRCAAEWKGNRFSNRKLREQLGWKPPIPIDQAMELFLAEFGSAIQ
jgi:nucleoside-diphosphate-sugar epimerase